MCRQDLLTGAYGTVERVKDLIHWNECIDKPPAEKANASGTERMCCIDIGGYLLEIERYIYLPDDRATVPELLVEESDCIRFTTIACQ